MEEYRTWAWAKGAPTNPPRRWARGSSAAALGACGEVPACPRAAQTPDALGADRVAKAEAWRQVVCLAKQSEHAVAAGAAGRVSQPLLQPGIQDE